MICTTLNKIRDHSPCRDGWQKLLDGLGKTGADDEPLPLVKILDLNGLDDALWALRASDCDREGRLLAVAYARQVEHLMADPRSVTALDVAERFANGQATYRELLEARVAAQAAADDAWAVADDAANAVDIADAVDAVRAAARAAAATWAAADTTTHAAAWAANAAWAAANDAWAATNAAANAVDAAAWAAADTTAMLEKQAELFNEIFG